MKKKVVRCRQGLRPHQTEKHKNVYLEMVEDVLSLLLEVTLLASDGKLAGKTEIQLLVSIATFLGDETSRWSTSNIHHSCHGTWRLDVTCHHILGH